MKKRTWSLALVYSLVACTAMTVHAEDYTGSDGWKVEFTGKEMQSNFRSAAMTETISAIQPGDSVAFNISLENPSEYTTDWYMTNEVLSSLEDSQRVAAGGGYTYILTYTDHEGTETVLYDSENVGGEKATDAGEGLHEATDNLDEFFYLDTLAPGQAGSVDLVVALDGETQGNAYQDTLAELQMNFAVEVPRTPTVEPTQERNPQQPQNPPQSTTEITDNDTPRTPGRLYTVRTSDDSHILGPTIAMGGGILLLILAAVRLLRKKGEES